MGTEPQNIAVAVGLAVAALCGLVVVWKVTKSLLILLFWLAAGLAVAVAAWWLLARQGILPPLPAL
ncbi:MAG: hypothetical protein KF791_01775 [Verrucomicrobiae bacterium]|nr:hypothetical protein [Verrucomicrobiae bacterium]